MLLTYVPEGESGEQLELISDSSQPVMMAPVGKPTESRSQQDMVEIKRFLEELLVRLT